MKSNIYTIITFLLFTFYISDAQNPANCSGTSTGASTIKVLIAGDSWAQYMWDDDVHNDVFNRYGHADKNMLSDSYGTTSNIVFGTPPSSTSTYAVSGSEARQWVNTASYPYLANTIAALNANPNVTTVVLSIGGNDVLAGRSGGGWYLGMGATAEAAFFNTLVNNVRTIIDAILAVRPNIEVLLSSYDYPNFNTTFVDCWIYACPKRDDLSDTNGDGSINGSEHLITDAEINQMMILIEDYRVALVNSYPSRVYFDNAVGLMHYYYGTNPNASAILSPTLPHPLPVNPYTEGGDPLQPTLRENFRAFYDPIHLDADGYQFKVKNEADNYFFTRYRKSPNITYFSEDANDGYINANGGAVTETGLRLGDAGTFTADDYFSILSFNTASLPDNAVVTGASIYLHRSTASSFFGTESNPFEASDKRLVVDIKNGFFGSAVSLESNDRTATASANDVGCAIGNMDNDFYAVRVDVNTSYLTNINKTGRTQFRMSFTNPDIGNEYVNLFDGNGDSAFSPEDDPNSITVVNDTNLNQFQSRPENEDTETAHNEIATERNPILVTPYAHNGLSKYMNSRAPFIDIWYTVPAPLDLVKFSATPQGKMVQLDWTVANETAVEKYVIEYSKDSRNWVVIGEQVANNISAEHNYEFLHTTPKDGANYYRLKMLDTDETSTYSKVELVYFKPQTNVLEVYPNPFSNYIQVGIYANDASVAHAVLYNQIGQIVATETWNLNEGIQIIPMQFENNLPKGFYLLKVTGDSLNEEIKIIKE